MSDIPEAIKEVLKELRLNKAAACWEIPQKKGQWAVHHFACERMAAHKGIQFDPPVPLHVGPDFVALSVTGHLNGRSEWSVGEASEATTKNKYYCAMAEKRAKDRVILKLIGVHGQVYAEDEADSFTEQGNMLEQSVGAQQLLLNHNGCVNRNWPTICRTKAAMHKGNLSVAAEAIYELTDEERQTLDLAPSKGGIWTTAEREAIFRPHGDVAKLVAQMKLDDGGAL